MNLWMCKIGNDPIDAAHVQFMRRVANTYASLDGGSMFEFVTDCYQYLSITSPKDRLSKCYNYTTGNHLYAYSGIIIDKNGCTDYCNAKSLKQNWSLVFDGVNGSYSILKLDENGLTCLVDPLGLCHVYYYYDESNNAYWISNDIRLIKTAKKNNINYMYFASKIILGEHFGNITEDNDTFILGPHGLFTYRNRCAIVSSYKPIESFTTSERGYQELLNIVAAEFKASARYLTRNYRVLIPLSGGFDSRLVLQMFSDVNVSTNMLRTYTHRSGFGNREVSIASRVAKYYGVPHEVIQYRDFEFPGIDEFLADSDRRLDPFRPLNALLSDYVISNAMLPFNEAIPVYISGDGGHTGGLNKWGFDKNNIDAAAHLLDKLIKSSLICEDWYLEFRDRLLQYFNSCYSKFKQQDMGEIYSKCERLRLTTGGGSMREINRICDYLTPYSFKSFIQAVFLCEYRMRVKGIDQSIHYELARRLTNDRIPNIEFMDYSKWNAGAMDRMILFSSRYLFRIYKRISGSKKHEAQLRIRYILKNRRYISGFIRRHRDSNLFKYVNYNTSMNIANDDASAVRHYVYLSSLIPILHYVDS